MHGVMASGSGLVTRAGGGFGADALALAGCGGMLLRLERAPCGPAANANGLILHRPRAAQ